MASVGANQPHLILLQIKLDYRANILPQTGCPAKFAFRLQGGSKRARSAVLAFFFGFSNITAKLFISEEKILLLKFRCYWDAFFSFLGSKLRQFLAELSRKNRLKLSNLQKSTKPFWNTYLT